MRRAIFILIFLLVTGGFAWAGTEAYKLVMSKDKELCTSMLKLFNEDVKKYDEIRYEENELFKRVPWQLLDISDDKHPSHTCEVIRRALFDINNDGRDDLVIKYSGCLQSVLSDSLFVFPAESDIISKLTPGPGGLSALFSAPDKFARTGRAYYLSELPKGKRKDDLGPGIGGVFVLNPFIKGKTSYISVTDIEQKWIVIAKYLKGETLKDVCYLQSVSAGKP